jgi:hypothetical protein
MKQYTILAALMAAAALLFPKPSDAAVHFGLPSAVKSTVRKLSKTVHTQKIEYILAAQTQILSAATNSRFLGVSSDSVTYRYSLDAVEVSSLRAGDIILSTQGNGYLKKVVSVVNTGTEYQIQTSTAALNEAFSMLDIDYHATITPANAGVQSLSRPQDVITIDSDEKFNLSTNTVVYDADGDFNTKHDQITTDLIFMFGISIDARIDMPSPQHLRQFYLKVYTEKELGLTLAADVGFSVNKDWEIGPGIRFPLWAVPPVIFNIEPKLIVDISLSGAADIHASGTETSYTGVICDNSCYNGNNWRVESSSSSSFGVDSVAGNSELSLQMGADVGLNAKLGDILGPFFSLFAGVKGSVTTPTQHLPYTVSVLAEARGGVKAEIEAWFVDITLFSWDTSLIKYEYPISSGSLLNQSPTISAVTPDPISISTGGVTGITCTASDSDSDNLTYNWYVGSGTVSGTGAQIDWTAPSTPSTYTITCGVTDGWGGSVQKSTHVIVALAASQNHAPTITSLTANPVSVSTGAATTITCAASDADSDPLTYTWSAASGALSGSGAQVTWTAPASSSTYSISCTVSDGNGGSAYDGVEVNVTMPTVVYALPDTGENQSFTSVFGEDHDYRPALSQPSYTDNGDGTVTDNRTGLVWQVTGIANTIHWEDGLGFCENLAHAGYTDWRLPNRRELLSIVDFGRYGPAIDTAYFPNTPNGDYWTSTTSPGAPTGAYRINFVDGYIGGFNKNQTYSSYFYSRCVRGISASILPDTGQGQSFTNTAGEDHDYQPPSSQPSYIDNGNGTTTDTRTELMWVRDGLSNGCNNGNPLSFDQALGFCESLTYGGYSDWRLPNVRELESLVDAGRYAPSINTTHFPNTKFGYYSSVYYWTSTAYWWVDFDYGSVADDNSTSDKASLSFYVRCVRSHLPGNNLPDAPTSAPAISGSEPFYNNQSYTYSAAATDPDGDQVKYRFYFDSDTVYTETGYVNSGVSASVTHIYTTVGTKSIKVKTVDSHGAESASWSPVLSVTMQLDPGGGGEI